MVAKSCTSLLLAFPAIYRLSTIQGGAGFRNHPQYQQISVLLIMLDISQHSVQDILLLSKLQSGSWSKYSPLYYAMCTLNWLAPKFSDFWGKINCIRESLILPTSQHLGRFQTAQNTWFHRLGTSTLLTSSAFLFLHQTSSKMTSQGPSNSPGHSHIACKTAMTARAGKTENTSFFNAGFATSIGYSGPSFPIIPFFRGRRQSFDRSPTTCNQWYWTPIDLSKFHPWLNLFQQV